MPYDVGHNQSINWTKRFFNVCPLVPFLVKELCIYEIGYFYEIAKTFNFMLNTNPILKIWASKNKNGMSAVTILFPYFEKKNK
jgi:hypothetical protein